MIDWRSIVETIQLSGWTLERLAEHLNVSERQVRNWKSGQQPVGEKAVRLYEIGKSSSL